MSVPQQLRYSKDHEWVALEGNVATVGITDFAQQALGDITYIELPKIGRVLKENEALGVVESVKAVSDVFAPLPGKVLEVNGPLVEAPDKVNSDPYESGWMVKLEINSKADFEKLMTAERYLQFVEENV